MGPLPPRRSFGRSSKQRVHARRRITFEGRAGREPRAAGRSMSLVSPAATAPARRPIRGDSAGITRQLAKPAGAGRRCVCRNGRESTGEVPFIRNGSPRA